MCCCLLLLLVAGIRGQGSDEFDLSEAFDQPVATIKPQPGHQGGITDDSVDITKKPTAKPLPGVGVGDEFDLGDALGGDAPKLPTLKPQPGGGGGAGRELDDSDLFGVGEHPEDPSGHDHNPGGHDKPSGADGQDKAEGNQSVVAGIVSAVAVAAVGAVSSFIAYQKKKLCFKGATDDPENVNMEAHKGDQSEPQVQSTLLAK